MKNLTVRDLIIRPVRVKSKNVRDIWDGRTALALARGMGHREMEALLRQHGAE
jgi:hypothetical protein